MRFFLIVLLVALAGVAHCQDASTRITYTTRAARASVVLKELGALAKVSLQAAPLVRDEVLVISVKDQPLSAVMSRIATVTSGEWKLEGAAYRLVPNDALGRQEEQAEAAKRTTKIKIAIRDMEDSLAKRLTSLKKSTAKLGSTSSSDAQAVAAAPGNMPNLITSTSQKVVLDLVKGLDSAVLAQMSPDDRFVFSNEPNRVQRELGSSADDVINNFIQTHNEQLAHVPPAPEPDVTGLTETQIANLRNRRNRRTAPIGQVWKTDLIVTRSTSDYARFEFELRFYNSKGDLEFTSLAFSSDFDSDTSETANEKPQEPSVKTTPVEYSDDSKALIRAMEVMDLSSFRLNLSPSLFHKLHLPQEFDPLSYIQTDELLSFAKWKGKPLVADVPDDYEATGTSSSNPASLESVEHSLKNGSSAAIIADDTFLVVKPSVPGLFRESRFDRLALARLIRSSDEKGVPSLDDFAAYALTSPEPKEDAFYLPYFFFFVPGSLMQIFGDNAPNWEMLRFYGSLGSDSRSRLAGGGSLAVSSLTTAQKAAWEQMTYGESTEFDIASSSNRANDSSIPYPTGANYQAEATELAPNGLPANGYIKLRIENEPFASLPEVNGNPTIALVRVLGPKELASIRMDRESKDPGDSNPKPLPFNRLKIGVTSVLNFTFHITPQVSIKQTLWDRHLPTNAISVSENNLPPDFQKQVADQLAILREAHGAGSAASGVNQKIHPH